VITPRATRLLRVPDLRAMHVALAHLVAPLDLFTARRCAVIVPTSGAAEALRRTLERHVLGSPGRTAAALPDLVTRAELYKRWQAQVAPAFPPLSDFEREVLFRRAARLAATAGRPAPFHVRPPLISQILAFYDELRRRNRTVADFSRLMAEGLAGSADYDRGADRLLRQTEFLSVAFEAFERAVDASGRIDEHGLRSRLLAADSCAHDHLVITVADQASDPAGLWTADYDLFARIPGLSRIDVVATDAVLDAGYLERIHDLLPGIGEERFGERSPAPILEVPHAPTASADVRPWFVWRDREEELADVARHAKSSTSIDRVAVVFQRPLPYLYLARSVFAGAGIAYQAFDALPLAAEPFAAAMDLVFTCVTTEATRSSLVELLGCPHWRFPALDGSDLNRADVAVLDAWLRDVKYLGGWESLERLVAENPAASGESRRRAPRAGRLSAALQTAVAVLERLRIAAGQPTASAQFAGLLAFIRDHERLPEPDGAGGVRHMLARAAVLAALTSFADAHARHDDEPLDANELAGAVRRWIEAQTFSPRTGWSGILLLDAPAAAYADVDDVRMVGLVESDWPDRSGRSIFYPNSLLSQLGWPAEAERQKSARARFVDLLRLPRERLAVSTFTLEDDSIVGPSAFLEELENGGWVRQARPEGIPPRVFVHEALADAPLEPSVAIGEAAAWLALRVGRSHADARAFHGFAGARAEGVYAVSHVERYLECPFKYFAAHVLKLDEEREDESGLTPRERGQLLHEVFERFFAAWHESGRQRLSVENVGDALALFAAVTEESLATLSEADRGLERTYLLGSAAASGLAERAFAFEIEHGIGVVERLLEYPLEGMFEFTGAGGTRRLRIRAKADRIDLLENGTLRVIDYKLGRAPKAARALQLPIYSVCASQQLSGRDGRSWMLGQAGYVAFREKNAFVALGGSSSLQNAIAEGQERLLQAVGGIERGEFPPDPDEPFLCTRCGYAGVCRKDYVGDE
jgi:RecB family exonuclease